MREGPLHGMQTPALGTEPLHGDHVRPLARVERGEARVDGAMLHLALGSVVIADHYGARAASALTAPEFGAAQPEAWVRIEVGGSA